MKRLFYLIALLSIAVIFLGVGSMIRAWISVWFLAEGAILGVVLAAALLLPGPPALWVELLGTTATLPLLWHVLPFELAIPSIPFAPVFLLYVLYLLLSFLLATMAPMFLLLTLGRLLE